MSRRSGPSRRSVRSVRSARSVVIRTAALAAGVAALAAGLSGCGIRGTAVPVDAGSAPSRATCVVHGPQSSATAGSATTSVQLLCTSLLLPVTRQVSVPEGGDPAALARALLDELKRPPSPAEDDAGFSTAVPQQLTVGGPAKGDPAGTLRLNMPPDDLAPLALAQVVCTFAGTPAADARPTVILGGPSGARPRSYVCTDETRTHPETVQSNGSPLPPADGR
ncbi:hypothetical protein [Streptomyces sp. NPDC037389]|uniref:hypothetical protein n=1 Tax=Streptomyces sp. NPDC037389 TaxID=3155369 RepID=UPI0033E670C1